MCSSNPREADFCRRHKRQNAVPIEHTERFPAVFAGLFLQARRAVSIRWFTAPAALSLVAFVAADARGQDASTLARTGTAAIEAHRFGDALATFTEAAAMEPGDATFSFGAGVAAFMLGQNEVARSRFERALALNPGHVPAALWLGDLHYRAGRLEQAISICEAALERAPRDRELRDRLGNWTREHELQSRFHEVRTSHFIVLFEAVVDEPFARRVLEQLETAYARIANALGLYPSGPITALIYSRQQFDAITRLASWSAAGYDGRIRVPRSVAVSERDELDRVLSHEFVHALVDMTAGRSAPAWLNEGLATALEPTDPTTRDPTPPNRAPLDISRLHRGFVLLSRRDAEAAYTSSARAVRRLLDQHGAATIAALLGDLRRGVPFASAFENRIAMRYEDFAALVAGSNP